MFRMTIFFSFLFSSFLFLFCLPAHVFFLFLDGQQRIEIDSLNLIIAISFTKRIFLDSYLMTGSLLHQHSLVTCKIRFWMEPPKQDESLPFVFSSTEQNKVSFFNRIVAFYELETVIQQAYQLYLIWMCSELNNEIYSFFTPSKENLIRSCDRALS